MGPWAHSYGAHLLCRSPGSISPPAVAASRLNPSLYQTTKAALRHEASARRDTLTTAERGRASAIIAERAIAIANSIRPRVIGAYMPIWSEVDSRPVISWAHDNDVAVVLPAVVGATALAFRRHRSGDPLDAGRFGTRAPPAHADTAVPDLVISPMIAFDRSGTRLGYGGGFYDREIARLRSEGHRPVLVGLAFAAQEVLAIPAEPHDARMDWIVTEKETLEFRRSE
jgi:5-formyltetrahydrofolate cyclo-ligase